MTYSGGFQVHCLNPVRQPRTKHGQDTTMTKSFIKVNKHSFSVESESFLRFSLQENRGTELRFHCAGFSAVWLQLKT